MLIIFIVSTRIYQRFHDEKLNQKEDPTQEYTFPQYEEGFGDAMELYWIGLKKLYKLTKNTYNTLRVGIMTKLKEQIVYDYHGFRIMDDAHFKMDYQSWEVGKCKYT